MNSYEISKDMCPDYGPMCNKCNANGHCLIEYLAKSLIRKNYCKVADDEIVVKKSGYEELSKDYATINNEAYYCGFSAGVEEATKTTAREILQEVVNAWNTGNLNQRELAYICTRYGIELEE